ncbi:hypothetical protein [Pseudomonas proteolytica]|uniref:hypothetical protein n=1 Tax=Pseudomonas proteolytica TaxID=219574 RepID=UPI0014729267|nr:hypothetical protein [Pseudomonas proteolytica]NMZ35393.1 hypothetical protein [Pseudomonas proteolytica]
MANPQPKLASTEDLVRLRDEIAINAMNAMVIAKGWGYTDGDGKRQSWATMREYSNAAYHFADEMLAARERK